MYIEQILFFKFDIHDMKKIYQCLMDNTNTILLLVLN